MHWVLALQSDEVCATAAHTTIQVFAVLIELRKSTPIKAIKNTKVELRSTPQTALNELTFHLIMTNVNNPRQQSFQLTHPIKHQRPYALPVSSSTTVPGETAAFRHAKVVDALPVVPEEGLHTVSDLVRRAASKFGDRPAVGYRTEIRTHVKPGPPDANGKTKELTVSELSPYKFLSYTEYAELVENLGHGLLKAGLDPEKDKLCMWAQTRLVHLLILKD